MAQWFKNALLLRRTGVGFPALMSSSSPVISVPSSGLCRYCTHMHKPMCRQMCMYTSPHAQLHAQKRKDVRQEATKRRDWRGGQWLVALSASSGGPRFSTQHPLSTTPVPKDLTPSASTATTLAWCTVILTSETPK